MKMGKFFAGVFLIAFATLVFFGIMNFGVVMAYFFAYPIVLSKLTGLPLNPHIVRMAATLFTTGLVFGVIFLCRKKTRGWGISLIVVLFLLHSGLMYFTEKNRYFSNNRLPLVWVAKDPITKEWKQFDYPGHDAFGQKLIPITIAIAMEISRRRSSALNPNNEIGYSAITNFFDPIDGRPLIYYCISDTGYRFFTSEGYDTKTGEPLLPITEAALKKYKKTRFLQNEETRPKVKAQSATAKVIRQHKEMRFVFILHGVETPSREWQVVMYDLNNRIYQTTSKDRYAVINLYENEYRFVLFINGNIEYDSVNSYEFKGPVQEICFGINLHDPLNYSVASARKTCLQWAKSKKNERK
jgi:hypothetical protein